MNVDALQRSIGYCFRNADLIRRALTHRSFGATHNERLEFLGDSIVNCVIARTLYQKFPELPEGELSRLRASLVSEPALAAVAEQIDLGKALLLGEGELKSGGGRRPSIQADALEAVIGAVFIDGGFDAASLAVEHVFRLPLETIQPATAGKDAKTQLQELLQGRHLPLPGYNVIAIHGEAHEQRFEVECVIASLNIRCSGTGTSRRRAEQEAARYALAQMLQAGGS
jgi:ribonuclease-3